MSGAECSVQTDRNPPNSQEPDMNTDRNTSMIFQALAAGTVALVMTWALSWSFVDSTRVARWVSAADVAASAVHAATDTRTLTGSFKAGLLQ